MSRGAPPTQMLSAVNPQTNQALAATGQVANQAAANRNQAMAIRSREQMQREQNDLARQMGANRNAIQMAGIAEQARSQSEYRDLLRDKSQMEATIAREGQAQKANQFQQDMDFRKSKYDEMLRMQDEELELRISASKSAGEARDTQLRKAQQLRQDRNALAIKLTTAQEVHEKGIEDTRPILDKFIKGGEEQILATQQVTDPILTDIAEGLTKDGLLGREGMRDVFGVDLGRVEESFGGILQTLNPLRIGVDDANVRQTMILRALGEDFYDPSALEELIPGGFLAGQSATVDPVNLQEKMHGRIASSIANNMKGIDESQRGLVSQGIREAFDMAGGDAASVKKAQERLAKVSKDAGVSMLVLNTVISGAANAIRDRQESFNGAGIPDSYRDLEDGINDPATGDAFNETFQEGATKFDAFVLKKLFSNDAVGNILMLGEGGDTTTTLQTFIDTASQELEREGGFRRTALEDLLGENNYGIEGRDDLLGALGGIDTTETSIEDLKRQQNLEETMEGDLLNIQDIQAQADTQAGELEALEAMLASRRGRR